MNTDPSIIDFIRGIPKAELHLHIEGTFEPEMLFSFAMRDKVQLRFNTVEELRAAYQFRNLQEFLDIYYEGAKTLLTRQDFYDMTWAYLIKANAQNVQHTEIFFDPQTHTERGVAFETMILGINDALTDAKKQFGMTSKIIVCILRHLDANAAMLTLNEALPYKHLITAIGLDSSELGNPPSKFTEVFAEARRQGFLTVAHAGEEGPPEYIWEALDLLKVSRIDHGNSSLQDEKLVERLRKMKIPLTLCPLSNLKLKVLNDLKDHPVKKMLESGLIATINSDDPAYFGGYINENYIAVAEKLNLTKEDITQLAKNSFTASFLSEEEKQSMLRKIDDYVLRFDTE